MNVPKVYIALAGIQSQISYPGFEALVDDSRAGSSGQGTHPKDPVLMESATDHRRSKGSCRVHTARQAHSQQHKRPT